MLKFIAEQRVLLCIIVLSEKKPTLNNIKEIFLKWLTPAFEVHSI